jgi:hypothetical protein
MRKIKRNFKNILQNWEIGFYMKGTVRPERSANNSAALVFPYIQVSLEARHSISSLSLPYCFVKAYLFTEILVPIGRNIGTFPPRSW